MYYATFENCPLTGKSSFVTYPYISDEKSIWYRRYGGLHSGIDILCDKAYSICKGVVAYVGQDMDNNTYSVTIQYNSEESIRYCNLKSSEVGRGDIIERDQLIGYTDNHLHFEYVTRTQRESIWPVRISKFQYYKQDPEDYASGKAILPDSIYYLL